MQVAATLCGLRLEVETACALPDQTSSVRRLQGTCFRNDESIDAGLGHRAMVPDEVGAAPADTRAPSVMERPTWTRTSSPSC